MEAEVDLTFFLESLEYFQNLSNIPISAFQNLEIDEHLEVAVCPFPNFGKFGKFGKHAPAVANPLGSQSCLWCIANKGNKDDRSAQAVQDEGFLSPAIPRTGFSTAPRPKVGNAHGSDSVAATIRPPEVRRTAIGFVGTITRTSPRGKIPFRGNTAYSNKCGVLQDLLTSSATVSEYPVCGVPVSSKAREDVQTVPRRIIRISRAGMPFPNLCYLDC